MLSRKCILLWFIMDNCWGDIKMKMRMKGRMGGIEGVIEREKGRVRASFPRCHFTQHFFAFFSSNKRKEYGRKDSKVGDRFDRWV